MKNIRLFFAVGMALLFAVSVSGQTFVRSLDDLNPNVPKKEQQDQQGQQDQQQSNDQDQTNPNHYVAQQPKTDQNSFTDLLSFWGFGAGYVYEFPTGKGSSNNGLHGVRVPIQFNHVFKNTHAGIYGLVGYEYNKNEVKADGATLTNKIHRIPILLHASLNFGDSKVGVILHGGPGLNVLAGGKSEIKTGKKTEKDSVKSDCDFTMGAGVGLVIKSLMIHIGFNGGLTENGGLHQCDVDASLILCF